jgi:thymidylate kinase
LAVDGNLTISEIKKLLARLWLFVPKPDLTFHVKVPAEVALRRKHDIPSLSYLQIRNRIYEELAHDEDVIVLDGTLDIVQLESLIFARIDNLE